MICKNTDCKNKALTFSDCCWQHLENKESYRKLILEKLNSKDSFAEGNFTMVDFSRLEFKDVVFRNSNLTGADFSHSILWHSDFEGANLAAVNLAAADISTANFKNTNLFKSNLSSARCWSTDFSYANLTEAELFKADLLNAKLFNSRLWQANISGVKSLTKDNFKDKNNPVYSVNISEKHCREARDTYIILKQYFLENGRNNDAHWASFREMVMERKCLLQNKDARYLPSLIMGLICGYGEKPNRVVLSSVVIILFYAVVYYLLNAIAPSGAVSYQVRFLETIYYSIVTFTTVGYGDFVPKAKDLIRLLAASEAFLGAFTMGLFVFTLARRYSAR